MSGLMPPNVLSYEGQVVVSFINKAFPPASHNYQFNVPTVWVDTAAQNAYILVGKPLNVANWVLLGGAPGSLATLTGDTGGAVMPAGGNINLLGGSGISTVGNPGSSTITFSTAGGGLTWIDESATSASMLVAHGYVADNAALCTLTLPATANFGDVIAVTSNNTGGWLIAQNSGQAIQIGKVSTTIW